MIIRRPVALTAAAALGLSGLFIAAPAFADEETPTPQQPGVEQEQIETPTSEDFQALEEAEIVGIGTNAEGQTVVVTVGEKASKAEAEAAARAFSADYTGEVVTQVIPTSLVAWAAGDVVGGSGFIGLTDSMLFACSVGFSAFAPDASPALISAGHCAFDQNGAMLAETVLAVPSSEPAVGGSGYDIGADAKLLGDYDFAQFGGPGNTSGADGDQNSTDISTITIDELGDWNLLPEVTDWSTAGAEVSSLAGSTIKVKNVGDVKTGQVSKSGRTTGFTTGTVGITHGWAMIEDRWVEGFSSDTMAAPGDSGGAVIQGNTAVGLISGGSAATALYPQFTWAASITDALEKIPGYEIELDIDIPAVTSAASGDIVEGGTVITGTAPANATVVNIDGVEVAVADGKFSFTAPQAKGAYSYEIFAANGMSASKSITFAFNVPLSVPKIDAPVDASTTTDNVTTISGTGVAGATVTLTGDVTKSTTVGADGTWAVTGIDLGIGEFTVSVSQSLDGETSKVVKTSFTVAPVAPAVVSVASGDVFAEDKAPKSLSGTGIAGATLTVAVGGELYSLVVDKDGAWNLTLDSAVSPGDHTVIVYQTVNAVDSVNTEVGFTVKGNAVVVPTPDPTDPVAPEAPKPGAEGDLADTGGSLLAPMSIAAGLLLVLGLGMTVVVAGRRYTAAKNS